MLQCISTSIGLRLTVAFLATTHATRLAMGGRRIPIAIIYPGTHRIDIKAGNGMVGPFFTAWPNGSVIIAK